MSGNLSDNHLLSLNHLISVHQLFNPLLYLDVSSDSDVNNIPLVALF